MMSTTNFANKIISVFAIIQDHPNVIKLYEYFEDETNVYLVTE